MWWVGFQFVLQCVCVCVRACVVLRELPLVMQTQVILSHSLQRGASQVQLCVRISYQFPLDPPLFRVPTESPPTPLLPRAHVTQVRGPRASFLHCERFAPLESRTLPFGAPPSITTSPPPLPPFLPLFSLPAGCADAPDPVAWTSFSIYPHSLDLSLGFRSYLFADYSTVHMSA